MIIKIKQKDNSFKQYILPEGTVLSNDLKEWSKHEDKKAEDIKQRAEDIRQRKIAIQRVDAQVKHGTRT